MQCKYRVSAYSGYSVVCVEMYECGSRVSGKVAGKDFQGRSLNRIFKDEQELPSFNGHSKDEYYSAEEDYEQVLEEIG